MCQCDELIAPSDDSAQSIKLCSICNKRVEAGRAGSLTQWVFRSDICECETPRPVDVDGVADGAASGSVAPKFESEKALVQKLVVDTSLKVDENSFPIDRYRAISEIGRGASGVVYLAHDLMLQKRVAIKCLKSLTSDQLMSFQIEAQATSKLNHAQIVKVFDFGAARGGAPYMVMEYFESKSLKNIIDESGPLSEQAAIPIFTSLARALAHAHKRGVFHRDVKNSNVLLRDTGDKEKVGSEIRVIDFGVAAFKESSHAGQLAKGVTLVGTPPYMAPDQLRGRPFDARSEIYSLGCLFVEALCGRPPFIGDTALETLNLHATQKTPSLAELRPDLDFSEEIESIVARCLEKEPEERFQTMNDLVSSLESMSSEHGGFLVNGDEAGTIDSGTSEVVKTGSLPFSPSGLTLVIGGGALLLIFGILAVSVLQRETPDAGSKDSSKTIQVSKAARTGSEQAQQDSKRSSLQRLIITGGSDESILAARGKEQIRDVFLEKGNFTEHGIAALGVAQVEHFSIVGSRFDASAVKALNEYRALKTLVVRQCPDFEFSSLSAFRGVNLILVALESGNINDGVSEFIRNQSQLQELRIIGSDMFTGSQLSAVERLPLRTLCLYNLPNLKDSCFSSIAKVSSLRELYLVDPNLESEAASNDSVSNTQPSQELMPEKLYRGGMYAVQPFHSLTALTRLQNISLNSDRMEDAQFKSLSTMSGLTELTLSGKQFLTPARASEIAKLKNLKSLTVIGPCLERVGLERICSMSNLERLTLCDSELTNTDLNVFPKSSISSLTLAGQNSISDSGLTFLSRMPRLNALSLPRVTFITPGGREEFIKAKPQCQVDTAER